MSFETVALFGVFVAAVGIAVGMSIEQFFVKKRRDAWRAKNKSRWDKRSETNIAAGPLMSKRDPLDATDQLRIVMGADFAIQPLLNKREARLFKELDRFVIDQHSEWQVMAQVSLGEILRCRDSKAYSCINSKRVDLLLVDGDCQPRHAIEYQGGGHYQRMAAARDAVKKEALRRAGIGYHEILAGNTTPSELRQLVGKLVDKAKPQTDADAGTSGAKPSPENAGRPWSSEDESELLRLFKSGKDIVDLASHFKRTQRAITARLEYLGVINSIEV